MKPTDNPNLNNFNITFKAHGHANSGLYDNHPIMHTEQAVNKSYGCNSFHINLTEINSNKGRNSESAYQSGLNSKGSYFPNQGIYRSRIVRDECSANNNSFQQANDSYYSQSNLHAPNSNYINKTHYNCGPSITNSLKKSNCTVGARSDSEEITLNQLRYGINVTSSNQRNFDIQSNYSRGLNFHKKSTDSSLDSSYSHVNLPYQYLIAGGKKGGVNQSEDKISLDQSKVIQSGNNLNSHSKSPGIGIYSSKYKKTFEVSIETSEVYPSTVVETNKNQKRPQPKSIEKCLNMPLSKVVSNSNQTSSKFD